ncbi:unnamed protein product [Sphagnum balticum]
MAISIPISQHVILLQGALQKQNMATNKLSSGRLRAAMWSCSASSSDSEDPEHSSSTMPPKLEPFSQSRISRLTPERSLLRKAEAALSDRCMALEGDKAYECWEALFKFEDIKEAYEAECEASSGSSSDHQAACQHLDRFENLVRQSDGVSGLIDNVRMVARSAKSQPLNAEVPSSVELPIITNRPVFPEDGGIPMSAEEQLMDESGLLPESPLTRMLRHEGRSAAWFTHPPDHSSD